MTTTVECYFVTPIGEPIVNSPVEFQPAKSGFTEELDGIIMPRPADAVTDALGQCTVELWPSPIPYYVRCSDLLSEAEVFYKITVPVVAPGTVLRLQDLVIETPITVPAGVQLEVVSDTELRVKLLGADGVSRSVILTLA